MKILIITPAAARSRHGNRNTAARWATMLRALGHRVVVQVEWSGAAADVMIALHARRSHDSIRRFSCLYPERPLVVALTGTDLYRDIRIDAAARESLRLATRMVVLQDMGLNELSLAWRKKTRVIYQSASRISPRPPLKSCFEVTVSGHLREEKDPFRAAAALAHLPAASRIRLTHLGGALSPDMARQAEQWQASEPRYRWLGELAHWQAVRILARSRLMVISSRMEGGANVVSEALAAGVPVIASRIAGNIGMLGKDYVGYYPPEDERALAGLLWRAESDLLFYRRLRAQCAARKRLVSPRLEKTALKKLLAELA
ncbi:MAG: selenoneine biosynthesis selenosugar synthase SenB [Burkholderiales bacterium]